MNLLDTILNFCQICTLLTNEPSVHLVQFVFSIVWKLVDASLDDEGLLQLTPEKQSQWSTEPQDMDIDAMMFLQNKVTSRILYLARQNIHSALWLPLDLLLEDAMDGYQVNATSAIEIVAGEVIFCINLNKKSIYVLVLALYVMTLDGCSTSCSNEELSFTFWEEESLTTDEIEDGMGCKNQVSRMRPGNLHHLIVEACIARNLLDMSVYFWPVNGSIDERIAGATILCVASLICGWNVQEHTVYFITRLLSPPVPVDYSGCDSFLVLQLAGSLMTICDWFTCSEYLMDLDNRRGDICPCRVLNLLFF
ncbi:unnamed protein product [Fraxinus pennsylvanica]|uniref:Uncharacterized protein n=1 Tax=Fraxinus pennsylvanica TaxID=56036 RepID=A0AAD2A0B8_9LAMI|nr:unnamed protein product [Fraxinus pennsylvanica]